MAEETLQEQGLNHVLDEETNEVVEVSDEMRRMAQTIQQRIDGATMVTAILLQVVRDQKLYLAWGCGSFKEYADTMLPFSRRAAYKYISIAEKFAPLLPELKTDGSVNTYSQLEENIAQNDQINELSGMGMSKLYELTKVPDSDIRDLSEGTFEINGKEYTWDDIKAQTVRDLQEEVRAEKKQLQKRLANLEEENKKHKSERDHYKESLEKNQDKIDRAIELESQYGKDAARMEEIDFNMQMAETALLKVERAFGKVDADEEAPEVVRERIRSFLRSLNRVQIAAQERYPWLRNLDEIEEFPSWMVKDDPRLDPESDEFDPDGTIDEVKQIRTDRQRMAIKEKTTHGISHGWANLEKGFKTEEEMEKRFSELLESDEYEEG